MATNQLNQQKLMVDNLRDMFNGSFDDEIIESILIQREWNGECIELSLSDSYLFLRKSSTKINIVKRLAEKIYRQIFIFFVTMILRQIISSRLEQCMVFSLVCV